MRSLASRKEVETNAEGPARPPALSPQNPSGGSRDYQKPFDRKAPTTNPTEGLTLADKILRHKLRLKSEKNQLGKFRKTAQNIRAEVVSETKEWIEERGYLPSIYTEDFVEVVVRKSQSSMRVPSNISWSLKNQITCDRAASWKEYKSKSSRAINAELSASVKANGMMIPEDMILRSATRKNAEVKNPLWNERIYSIPKNIEGRAFHPRDGMSDFPTRKFYEEGLSILRYLGINNSGPVAIKGPYGFDSELLTTYFRNYRSVLAWNQKDPFRSFCEAAFRSPFRILDLKNNGINPDRESAVRMGKYHFQSFFIEERGKIFYCEPEFATKAAYSLYGKKLYNERWRAAIMMRALYHDYDDISDDEIIHSAMVVELSDPIIPESPKDKEEEGPSKASVEALEEMVGDISNIFPGINSFWNFTVAAAEQRLKKYSLASISLEGVENPQDLYAESDEESESGGSIATGSSNSIDWNMGLESDIEEDVPVVSMDDWLILITKVDEFCFYSLCWGWVIILSTMLEVLSSQKKPKRQDLMNWFVNQVDMPEAPIQRDRFTVVAGWPRSLRAYGENPDGFRRKTRGALSRRTRDKVP